MRNEDAVSRSGRGREVVCVDITNNPNQKFNVALFDYPCCLDVEENLEAPAKQILRANKEKFEALALRVGRMHTRAALDVGSGVTFAVAPGLLMTCRHVSFLGGPSTQSISTGIRSFHLKDIQHPVAIQELPVDKNYLDALAVLDRDPMSEQHDDFKDFDIALFTLPSPPWRTLFPTDWSPLFPDVVIPGQGATIATIHYPGDPSGPQTFEITHPSDPSRSRIYPVGKYLQVFRALGEKAISVGQRLVATNHPGPGDANHPPDNILAYDLAMLGGSSGAPIVRIDAPANTFCGVHIGGEYFMDWRFPKGWNHAYSVANPHFVLMYVRYVVPHWRDQGGIPDEVRLYVRAHHNIISAHRGWLGDMTNWLLML